MAMRIKRQARRASDLLQPALFVFTPRRPPENRWATSVSHVGQTTQWSSVGNGKQHAHRRRAERPHRSTGNHPARSSAWSERTLVASDRMARRREPVVAVRSSLFWWSTTPTYAETVSFSFARSSSVSIGV